MGLWDERWERRAQRDSQAAEGPHLSAGCKGAGDLWQPELEAHPWHWSSPGEVSCSLLLLNVRVCSHISVWNLVKLVLISAARAIAFLHNLFLCTQDYCKSLKIREETAIWKSIGHHIISRWWRGPQSRRSRMSITVYQNWLNSIHCFDSYDRTSKQSDDVGYQVIYLTLFHLNSILVMFLTFNKYISRKWICSGFSNSLHIHGIHQI